MLSNHLHAIVLYHNLSYYIIPAIPLFCLNSAHTLLFCANAARS